VKERILIYGLLALLILAVSSAMYAWFKKPDTVTQTEYTKPQKVVTIREVAVPGPKEIVTLDKDVVVKKLALPDWVKNDPNEQATATAVIDSFKGKTNTVALLNVKTGVGQILAKQESLPLFGFLNDREIGIRAGANTKGEPVTSIYGQYDFVRVGSVKVGVYADADSTGQAKAQIGVGFKF
jgi:hypothetical protein